MSGTRNGSNRRFNLLLFAVVLVFILVVSLDWLFGGLTIFEHGFTITSDVTATNPTTTSLTSTMGPPLIATLTPTPTLIRIPTITFTLTPLPPPIIGAVGPEGFDVIKWRTDACNASRQFLMFDIYSLVVSGSPSPYKFIFEQDGKAYERFAVTTPPDLLPFITPTPDPDRLLGKIIYLEKSIKVRKGKYVHVTIYFHAENNVIPYVDDLLFYQQNPDCP